MDGRHFSITVKGKTAQILTDDGHHQRGGTAWTTFGRPIADCRVVPAPPDSKAMAKPPLTEGLECDYFYNQAHCDVPDLGALTPAHTAILPNINMGSSFPHVRQTWHFCMRCSGYVSIRTAGGYKFHTASDDGSLLYVNGERIVDNNGCHGEEEKSSNSKYLSIGLHHLMVDFCEKSGGQSLKMRYEGPDTGDSKVIVPASVLKHEPKAFAPGLECEYFYNKAQCKVPDLGALTPAHTEILPNIDLHRDKFPHVRQTNNFCLRCSGFVTTSTEGEYKFFTSSDDGSLLYLNGEKIVDNNDCHGEKETASNRIQLAGGSHHLVVDYCNNGGGHAFKMRFEGPDSRGNKVEVPASALKHELKAFEPFEPGLECDYFYNQAHCDVPDLGALTPAHTAILPNINMGSSFPHVRQTWHFCMRCSGYVSIRTAGGYKFHTASDDGSLLYVNGERIVDNNGCHGEEEKSSNSKYLSIGLHHLMVDFCEKSGGQSLKMRYEGPDTGDSKVIVPASVLKHDARPR